MQNNNLLPQAVKALNSGQFAIAYNSAVEYLRLPNLTDKKAVLSAHTVAGSALMLTNKPTEALKHFNQANAIFPNRSDISAYLSRCYLAASDIKNAKHFAELALKQSSPNAQSLSTAGVVLSHCQDHQQALKAFKRAIKQAPTNAEIAFNLACSYKFTGDFTQAEASYEKALELNPQHGLAISGLSEIPNKARTQFRINRLEQLADTQQIDEYRYYALAREYERLGDYEKAFAAFTQSANARRNKLNYHFDQDKQLFDSVKANFDRDFVENTPASNSELEPIFIVGMPRTGTTLLERILSNHSTVVSYGELKYFPASVKLNSGVKSENAINSDVFAHVKQFDYAKIAEKYAGFIQSAHQASPRFTDKLPINYFYVGAILKAFPKAKILVLRRGPLDTCLSNFRQLFGSTSIHQYHTNSLADTAKYYIEFDGLIQHWKTLFGDNILEVHYEELVADPARIIRNVLDYAGLDWQQNCLHFHKNPQPLATASAYQARQPIYKDSANRAAQYGELLKPTIDIFNKAGII